MKYVGIKIPRYIGYFKNKPYCRLCVKFRAKDELSSSDIVFNEPINYANYKLTEEQKLISNKLLENFIKKKNSLVHAVCGAGKTELCFEIIGFCIKNKLNVGFAIPRKDVVIELYYRFKNIFKDNSIVPVYGGNTDKLVGELIILTTHQLYRYKNYFDLLILDEIDAFPFKNNQVLQSFLRKSIKGNVILMSATITETQKQNYKNKGFEIITLYKRFHNFPIPVPKIIKKMGILKMIYLIKYLKKFEKENKPCIVFVPTIDISEKLFWFLRFFFKKINYVNSKIDERNKIISEFKDNKINILVSTSVLERGVTFSNLQVIIYDTYNPIYDVQTLVQISGRVGRKKEFPDGEVIFLSYKITRDMLDAINTIKEQNKTTFQK